MSRRARKTLYRLCLPWLCLSLMTGCAGLDAGRDLISGLSDSLFGDDESADPPAVLTDYTPEVQLDVLWKTSVGDGADQQYLKLIPAVQGDRIFVAERGGRLQARSTSQGDLVWETDTEYPFEAGPGISARNLVMGCSNGVVVGFDIGSGQQKWQTTVPSEVQAVPVISQGIVIVRTTDGKVIALREADGTKLWTFEHNVPALSIRGAGAPMILGDIVYVGQASGKLEALQLSDGKSLWEATIAIPSGRSEVERLVDLDVDPIDNRGSIFVSSFQGGTSAIAEADGDVVWRNQEVSSYTGLSNDRRYLYVSDTQSEVWQLDQRNGAALWRQKELRNRRLSAAVAYDNYVVVGDFEGYVHWLSNTDGRLLGRIQISNTPIEAKPVVIDGTVYIYAKDGTLAALKAR